MDNRLKVIIGAVLIAGLYWAYQWFGTATIAVLWGSKTREQLAACEPDHMVETVSSLAQLLTEI